MSDDHITPVRLRAKADTRGMPRDSTGAALASEDSVARGGAVRAQAFTEEPPCIPLRNPSIIVTSSSPAA